MNKKVLIVVMILTIANVILSFQILPSIQCVDNGLDIDKAISSGGITLD